GGAGKPGPGGKPPGAGNNADPARPGAAVPGVQRVQTGGPGRAREAPETRAPALVSPAPANGVRPQMRYPSPPARTPGKREDELGSTRPVAPTRPPGAHAGVVPRGHTVPTPGRPTQVNRPAPAPRPASTPAPRPTYTPAPGPTPRSTPAPAPRSMPAPAPRSMPTPAPRSTPAPAPRSTPAPAPRSTRAPAPAHARPRSPAAA